MIAESIGVVGGMAIGAVTANPYLSTVWMNAIAAAVMLSPVGKLNIYFKKEG